MPFASVSAKDETRNTENHKNNGYGINHNLSCYSEKFSTME